VAVYRRACSGLVVLEGLGEGEEGVGETEGEGEGQGLREGGRNGGREGGRDVSGVLEELVSMAVSTSSCVLLLQTTVHSFLFPRGDSPPCEVHDEPGSDR